MRIGRLFKMLSVHLAVAPILVWAAVAQAQVSCPASTDWIEHPESFDVSEPTEKTEECPFYQRAWQAFLHVTELQGQKPAFLKYDTFQTIFRAGTVRSSIDSSDGLTLSVRTAEEPGPIFDGGIDQALSSAVVDKNGNPIFYSIEIDPVFAKFISDTHLDDLTTLRDATTVVPEITDGAMELKASWQVIEDESKFTSFVTTTASVPTLKQVGEKVETDYSAPMRSVRVALLGIHVVFKLANHPEFIWSTFEHVGANGEFDIAPRASGLPEDLKDRAVAVSDSNDFLLFQPGTTYEKANQELRPMTLMADGHHIAERSSIYRAYPWSQKRFDGNNPLVVDDDIEALNEDVKTTLFVGNRQTDVRKNYKLVGAVWLKDGAKSFHTGVRVAENELLGERGLSNAAIESMTQEDFPHCFSCHNPVKGASLIARPINVSHLFTKFSAEH